jgi:hypothetical protein
MMAGTVAEPAAKRLRAGVTEEERKEWGLTDAQVVLPALDDSGLKKLRVAEVQQWVAAALTAGGLEGSVDDESRGIGKVLKILRDNEVTGAALVNLTLEELLAAPLSLAFGPAKVLAMRIAAAAPPPQVLELCFVAPPPPHCPRETWDLDRSRRLGGFE